MKAHLKHFVQRIDFWNFFIGLIVGFGLGVMLINALVPNANELIYMYHMDKDSRMMDSYRTWLK